MPTVYASALISAPVVRVWDLIRDFSALPAWHPSITESHIEGYTAADRVGCVRSIRLKDGGTVREQLLALSDYDYTCTYSILESPLAVDDYVATLCLMPVTDGDRTFAEWSAEFSCAADKETALTEQIKRSVFESGLLALKKRFGGYYG